MRELKNVSHDVFEPPRAGNISGLRNAAIVHLTKTLADQLGASGIYRQLGAGAYSH